MMKLNVYVMVRDMDKSVAFYKQLFAAEPIIQSEGYSAFSLEGALYGLFNVAAFPLPVTYGNNCTPNLYVGDLAAEYARVQAIAPPYLSDIRTSQPYQLFVLADPDGNPIELYSEAN
jgi:catechol 2,3-dioxygenase-like lactoylglutathione lyase family enzyme